MAMAFPASLVALPDIHRARVTSQLQSIDRARSSIMGAFILAAVALCRNEAGSLTIPAAPPKTKRVAIAAEPARLPSQTKDQSLSTLPAPTLLFSQPIGIYRVCPVNSSEPANTTNVRAMPKLTP